MKKDKVDVFVYGTLKRGKMLNSRWMYECEFVGEDEIEGEMVTLGWYPAVFLTGKGKVEGEIWRMPKRSFNRLAGMEEDAGYRTTTVTTKSGKEVKVFEHTNLDYLNQKKTITVF